MLLYNYFRFFFWWWGSIAIWCGKGPQTGLSCQSCLGAILVWQGCASSGHLLTTSITYFVWQGGVCTSLPCQSSTSAWQGAVHTSLPCRSSISAGHWVRDTSTPLCHIDRPFWCDKDMSTPSCHIDIPFRLDERVSAPLLPPRFRCLPQCWLEILVLRYLIILFYYSMST